MSSSIVNKQDLDELTDVSAWERVNSILSQSQTLGSESIILNDIDFELLEAGTGEETKLHYLKSSKDSLPHCSCGVFKSYSQTDFYDFEEAFFNQAPLAPCVLDAKISDALHEDFSLFSDLPKIFDALKEIEAFDVSQVESFTELLVFIRKFLRVTLLVNSVDLINPQHHELKESAVNTLIISMLRGSFKSEAAEFLGAKVSHTPGELSAFSFVGLRLSNVALFDETHLERRSSQALRSDEDFSLLLDGLVKAYLKDVLLIDKLMAKVAEHRPSQVFLSEVFLLSADELSTLVDSASDFKEYHKLFLEPEQGLLLRMLFKEHAAVGWSKAGAFDFEACFEAAKSSLLALK